MSTTTPSPHDTLRVRLDLAYDGTGFAGWATQPRLRTVQGLLEDALATVLRTGPLGLGRPRLTVAGRTDAGVHARGQVAHVDVPRDRWDAMPGRSDRTPGTALADRLAGVLPPDVVVHRASEAPGGFDARFSALHRRYAYRIADRPGLRDPLRRDWVLWHRRPLDVDAMDAAMRPLVGLHDFAAFCRPREGATTIRELTHLSWERPAAGPDAGLVVATVQADAFCHSMVRSLVGMAIAVGEGRRDVDAPAAVLAGRSRAEAASVVAARGLVLEEVAYPDDDQLAARAERIRAKRSTDEVDPAG
ncbi:tRNA pseudouridine(38-40) synthase TruA [Isoptericola sp. NEAU-Y5]|uniref:tRNA pseudouridine synthase A n=1 Tax=Isoptericola luteus TaxID=2879484 RepID=A0ABS7ZC58_9MICO|nr:tRNA pseudouridine(38-40) synthase TruA [Isoptericola sp. NEAU-Y5]MCA5892638.1 tRNA pseudouridine(38-40) synthase TruA [Isoptericola sp. NEAU-Y5]